MKIPKISLGAMWFGASISIAEILTGTYAASIGFVDGFLAILIGHILGCSLLFAMAYLGVYLGENSMRVTKHGFGHKGACIFAFLNALQLFGWGSVMIYNGGLAISGNNFDSFAIFEITAIIITVLLIIWLLFIKKESFTINTVTVVLLGVICLILSIILVISTETFKVPNNYTFSMIIEFSVAMPISWLPVIADYTSKHHAKKQNIRFSLVASMSYLIGGCWMYFIGMFSMLKFGADDIYKIMQILPIFGITAFVIIMSTVVNTFIDGVSAGESIASFSKSGKIDKYITIIGVFVLLGGLLMANIMFINNSFVDIYQAFLGLIAAVFAPMATVLIVKVIIFKHDSLPKNWDLSAFIPWIIGFILYELMHYLSIETYIGITLPVIIVTAAISCLFEIIIDSNSQITLSKGRKAIE